MTKKKFLEQLDKFPERKEFAGLTREAIQKKVGKIPIKRMIVNIQEGRITLTYQELTEERWFKVIEFICISQELYGKDVHLHDFMQYYVVLQGEEMLMKIAKKLPNVELRFLSDIGIANLQHFARTDISLL